MQTKLISRKGFMDYDVANFGTIHRACVPYKIKKGDTINVYMGESTKIGITWLGNLRYSLLSYWYNTIHN